MKRCLRAVWLAVPFLMLIGNAASAQQQTPRSADSYPDREFHVSMYLWGAGLEGSVGGDSISTDLDVSFGDIVDHLNIGAMGAVGARWGRFVGVFDALWLQLESDTETGSIRVGPLLTLGPAEIDAKLSQGMADLKVGFRILEPDEAHPIALDLLAGGRYWYVRTEIDADFALLADRSVDDSVDWVDPIIGARLGIELTPALEIVVLGDVGGWDVGSASHATWQLMGLLGYQLSEAWSTRVGYRSLKIERDLSDIDLQGPIAGVVYRF